MIIKILLLNILLTISFDGAACSRPEIAMTFQNSIERITQIQTPWSSFDYAELRFVIKPADSKSVYGYGFQADELLDFSNVATPCEVSSWTALSIVDVPAPINGFYSPISPSSEGSILQRIAHQHGSPILLLLEEPSVGGFDGKAIARIGVHELFHFQHQFNGKFVIGQGFPRDFLDQCVSNDLWLESLNEEFALWSSLLKDWDELTKDQILERVRIIIEKRSQSAISETDQFCWNATRFWERLEGTAYYVETESAFRAGFSFESELRSEAAKYLSNQSTTISTGAPETGSGKVNPSYFYATGALFCRVIKHIQPTINFETLIENGLSPQEAFSKVFDKNKTH